MCVFGRQLYINIFEKKLLTYQYVSFESVHGEISLKMGEGGKGIECFLLNGIKCVKNAGCWSADIFGYQYKLITKPSASFENSTSAHGEVFQKH